MGQEKSIQGLATDIQQFAEKLAEAKESTKSAERSLSICRSTEATIGNDLANARKAMDEALNALVGERPARGGPPSTTVGFGGF